MSQRLAKLRVCPACGRVREGKVDDPATCAVCGGPLDPLLDADRPPDESVESAEDAVQEARTPRVGGERDDGTPTEG